MTSAWLNDGRHIPEMCPICVRVDEIDPHCPSAVIALNHIRAVKDAVMRLEDEANERKP